MGKVCAADRDQIVIEPLEREAVQVDEIAGNMQADDAFAAAALDRTQHEPVHDQGTVMAMLAAVDDHLVARQQFVLFDELLEPRSAPWRRLSLIARAGKRFPAGWPLAVRITALALKMPVLTPIVCLGIAQTQLSATAI